MEIKDFVEKLNLLGFYLTNEEGKLVLKVRNDQVSQADIENLKGDQQMIGFMKVNKEALLDYIATDNSILAARSSDIASMHRLTELQQGMLFHTLYNNSGSTYVAQLVVDLTGLDVAAFIKSWEALISGHSMLRTCFYPDSFRIPVQCVLKQARMPVTLLDYREMSGTGQQAALQAWAEADRSRGFTLTEAPLMRLAVIRLSAEQYRVYWTHHLMIVDGWSLAVVMEEVLRNYGQLLQGEVPALPAEDRYADYIQFLEKRDKAAERRYWETYLGKLSSASLLPFIGATPERNKGTGLYLEEVLQLSASTHDRLQSWSQSRRLTVNTLMQGIWAIILGRYTGSSEVVYGITVSGRPEALENVERRVGMYINTVPLYASVSTSETLWDWLDKLQQEQIRSREYQYCALSTIQQWAGISGDLFDSLLVFENYPVSSVISSGNWGLEVKDMHMAEQTNYPLTLVISSGTATEIRFSYNASLLEPFYVKQLAGHFERLLESVLESAPSTLLGELEMLGQAEQQELLLGFNDTAAAYPQEATLDGLFVSQAAESPLAIALADESGELSYGDLDKQSNRLAHYLLEQGVVGGSLVPVCLDRGMEMIITLLAILKAGCAYVPIDPEYPSERIRYMLEDTAASHVIISAKHQHLAGHTAAKLLVPDQDAAVRRMAALAQTPPPVTHNARSLAYVIYTSGSTGKPKGVMVEHRSVVNRLIWAQAYFGLKASDVILQKTTFCFDVSVWELFWPIISGAKLVFAKPQGHKQPDYLAYMIDKELVTVIHFVPVMLEAFLANLDQGTCKSLKTVICSGEPLKISHVQSFYQVLQNARLYNLYGPTEAAIDVTCWDVPRNDTIIMIGKPIANTQIYITDTNGRLCPKGVYGQLSIGGVQVARGYLKQAALTDANFVDNPYNLRTKMYRTGDIGRWSADGNIEFLGRHDQQVKIKGFRIELEEIEYVVLQSQQVANVTVLAVEDNSGDKRLVAYISPLPSFNQESLEKYLYTRLPEYMVPGTFLLINEMPLTDNGKVDKRALLKMDWSKTELESMRPISDEQKIIASIWEELLNVKGVGLQSDFFSLGGDSIKVIRLISQMQKLLKCKLQLAEVYKARTLEQMAGLVHRTRLTGKNDSSLYIDITKELAIVKDAFLNHYKFPETIETVVPMSDIQRGMTYASLRHPEMGMYHDQFIYPFLQAFDYNIFRNALNLLVAKHQTLRTSFYWAEDAEGLQLVFKHIEPIIQYFEIQELDPQSQEEYLKSYLLKQKEQPFLMDKAPLWRTTIFKTSEQQHVILFECHHAILDGWSVASLNTEINNLYYLLQGKKDTGALLQPLKCDLTDYILENIAEKRNNEAIESWKNELDNYKRLDIFTNDPVYENLSKTYSNDLLERLLDKTKKDSVSLKSLFFGTYLYILSTLTYQDELTVGLVSNTRLAQEDGDKLLGCFLNTVPVRVKKAKRFNWESYFQQVEHKINEIKSMDRVSLLEITKIAGVSKSEENPFFDTIFDFLDFHIYDALAIGDHAPKTALSKKGALANVMDRTITNTFLDCVVNVSGGELVVNWFLQRKLKSEKSLNYFADVFQTVLYDYLERDSEVDRSLLLPQVDFNALLNTFSGTARHHPVKANILDLFKEQVDTSANSIAVVFGDTALTYKELDERSTRLSNYLCHLGVKTEMFIPVFLERSAELIIAIFGILKAGAAYVPIDTEYPTERIEFMLNAVDASVILTSNANRLRIPPNQSYQALSLDGGWEKVEAAENLNFPVAAILPTNLAYVIFTSGSTGLPKGVLIEHKGIVNLVTSMIAPLDLKKGKSIFQFASVSFDASCYEIFCTLLTGGKLVLSQKQTIMDPYALAEVLKKENVELITIPPSYQSAVIAELKSLKTIVSAGEALDPITGKTILQKGIKLINAYGPTESSVCASLSEAPFLPGQKVTIGKPITNTQVFILDANNELLALGASGELCIAGVGLARGYLNQPALTDERFITNSFNADPESKIYKTGDLARWLPDGNLEYLGRLDHQLKYRGYRIEPGEIENTILESKMVSQAIVMVDKENRAERLMAYVVPEIDYDQEAVNFLLKSKLPDYMVPQELIEVAAFPLTANGKIDRKALTGITAQNPVNKSPSQPRNDLERKLAVIWQELLEVKNVGISDDFFELGGHSLLAIKLLLLIRKETGIVVSIASFFQLNTIQAVAQYIAVEQSNQLQSAPYSSIRL